MEIPICCFTTLTADAQEPTVLGMPSYLVWIIIAILLIISGIYSASENAYTNCNKYHFKAKASKNNFTAKLIVRLIEKFDNTLVTVLVGNNIVQTFMSYLSAMLFYNMSLALGWADGIEAIVSTIVMAFLVYIVSDTVPKILSKTLPNHLAVILAYPVTITNIILFPIIILFKGILSLVHKLFKIKEDSLLTKEDLIHVASQAINEEDEDDKEKLFENNEKEILKNAFEFVSKKVKDEYIKIEDVTMIDIDNITIDEVNQKIINSKYSRIPCYEETKENIVGILVLKTYFEEYTRDPHLEIRSILEDVVKIDASMNIDEAFDVLNKEKVHLGLVYDKEILLGIISMEDLLEVLIDDIDEHPFDSLKKETRHV